MTWTFLTVPQPDHGQDTADRERMAGTSSGRSLRCGIYGCHPLSCTQRGTDRKTGCLYCTGDRYGRKKRCTRHVCGGKRKIQQCIIHQIRNSTKSVSYKDIKKLMADLKRVYAAPTEETALNELELFKDQWDSKYPMIYKSWNDNWATLSTYFKYPEAVRRLIYTTDAIEGFNRQLWKLTKAKTVLPTDDSLLKMLYLAMMDITKKWTGHRQDWGQIHSQIEIYLEERLSGRDL